MQINKFGGFSYLVIFNASLSGSDDFVLFESSDGNAALFANVLCDFLI